MLVVEMVQEKETPGTIRYAEVESEDGPPILKTQYIQKWAARQEGMPKRIRVTIESLD